MPPPSRPSGTCNTDTNEEGAADAVTTTVPGEMAAPETKHPRPIHHPTHNCRIHSNLTPAGTTGRVAHRTSQSPTDDAHAPVCHGNHADCTAL